MTVDLETLKTEILAHLKKKGFAVFFSDGDAEGSPTSSIGIRRGFRTFARLWMRPSSAASRWWFFLTGFFSSLH